MLYLNIPVNGICVFKNEEKEERDNQYVPLECPNVFVDSMWCTHASYSLRSQPVLLQIQGLNL